MSNKSQKQRFVSNVRNYNDYDLNDDFISQDFCDDPNFWMLREDDEEWLPTDGDMQQIDVNDNELYTDNSSNNIGKITNNYKKKINVNHNKNESNKNEMSLMWACTMCTYVNTVNVSVCTICSTKKQGKK